MTEQKFKTGDLVVLNSGGPTMTVEFIKPTVDQNGNMATCTWFTSGVLKRDCFNEMSLKIFKPASIL